MTYWHNIYFQVNSVRVVNEKERERRAQKARESRRERRRGEGYPLPRVRGLGRGLRPVQQFFCLALVHFSAFWVLVLMLQLTIGVHRKK